MITKEVILANCEVIEGFVKIFESEDGLGKSFAPIDTVISELVENPTNLTYEWLLNDLKSKNVGV